MGESKQVKVDNWGIFFLQRLQHFFNKTYFCDLTLQFEDNVQLKVHRLVMNACTEYFQLLEQTCEVINDCLIMPPDLQADVVVPIVNFMYTGILEFQTSIFDRLYSTARMMNMTVLTKLLDAQKVPISPITKPITKRTPVSPITWNLQGKKIQPKVIDPDLPETLPGRKLPIWKRKSLPSPILADTLSSKYFRASVDDTPKPTRFEWPEEEDENNVDTSSFDEISYSSKPIILPSREKSPKPSTSNSASFEELKRSTNTVKRAGSPIYNESSKKVNIQDVKEYIKEQKLRSDYIDYDDSEAADNDLQTTYIDDDSGDETSNNQNSEESPNKSILKNDSSTPHNKRVRFTLDGKENTNSKTAAAKSVPPNTVNLTNHTKIITEVLKKYPHLVKKNKNIRLKILAKNANLNASGIKPSTPLKVVKPTAKVSYMVMKPDANKSAPDNKKDGHWSCHRCSNPNPLQFDQYHLYRKHLTEVHNEKGDSQMCSICGHVSRKQNMLMYHKYVKHHITPPAMYQFPKCKECPYIALSPTLLVRHQQNAHQDLHCSDCNLTFVNKQALASHTQMTGHTPKPQQPRQTYDCSYCYKKFISDETLFLHIKNNHTEEAKRDNILSESDDTESEKVPNIITTEEIDALAEQEIHSEESSQQEQLEAQGDKPNKIKILSDIKVNTTMAGGRIMPVKQIAAIPASSVADVTKVVQATVPITTTTSTDSQPLEPSSEAESLSNVASGIAASLGLVNTIVVLDENQFNESNFILPDVANIENIQNLHVSQHQVITADNNTIISQATLGKNNIGSTDELVMVLTDHDYSDATNNTVITSENSNIVVLYSHPVQGQDGQFLSQQGNLLINPDTGIVEVSNDFTVNNTVIESKPCEESIEMIQQEINNHLEGEMSEMVQEIPVQQTENLTESVIDFTENKSEEVLVPEEELNQIVQENVVEKMNVDPIESNLNTSELQQQTENQPEEFVPSNNTVVPSENITEPHFEEPMEIEESIELIQKEIDKNSSNLQNIIPQEIDNTTKDIVEENAEQNVQQLSENDTETEATNISENTTELDFEKCSETLPNIEPESEKLSDFESKSEKLPDFEPESEKCSEISTEKSTEPIGENQNDFVQQESADYPVETSEKQLESITETSELQELQQEEKNERIPDILPEVEQMEVDSAKISETENLENTLDNNEPIPDPQVQKLITNISDEIVPDSEEEKSVTGDEVHLPKTGEISQQNEDENSENTTQIEEQIIPQNVDQHEENHTENVEENHTENIEENNTENIKENIVNRDESKLDIVESENEEKVEENKINPQEEITENSEILEETVLELEAENLNENISQTDADLNVPVEETSNIKVSESQEISKSATITNPKISNLLDDWDDGDTDSQQSDTPKQTEATTDNRNSINTLINDWEDEEET